MNMKRAEELASGMVGQLSDISPVELCQMINSNQKTGKLNLESEEKRAKILFNEGELVHAEIDGLSGKEAFYKILTVRLPVNIRVGREVSIVVSYSAINFTQNFAIF